METVSTSEGITVEVPERIHGTSEPRGHHGVPHPVNITRAVQHPVITTVVGAPGAGTPDSARRVIHHWTQGPQDVERTPAVRHRLRDGSVISTRHRLHWYLERVEGVKRAVALRAINDVLRHPATFMRAGVHWARTVNFAAADLIVRIIPADDSVCGPGSAGCYSWGYEAHGKPVVEIGVEYVGSDEFAMLVNHELGGHATFRMHDMYPIPGVAGHDDYDGTMGTWEAAARSGYYPPAHEVQWAKAWLAGEATNVHDH